jgi:hypothetical protein
MMQRNMMKTLYLVFLVILGTVWPWISANAQDSTLLTVTAPFAIREPSVTCTTQFQCVDQNGPTDCHFGCSGSGCPTEPIAVTLQSMTCPRGDRSCIDNPGQANAVYNPSQNALVSPVNFIDGNCHCSAITLTTTPVPAGGYRVTASGCTGAPPIFPAGSTNGRYTITGVQYTGTGN